MVDQHRGRQIIDATPNSLRNQQAHNESQRCKQFTSGRRRVPGILGIVGALVLGSVAVATPASAICVAPKNVTGEWVANDGGHYFMRRVGNNIWWLGVGPGFKNVFKGTTDFNTITGQWADVDPVRGSGTLTLKIHGEIGKGILQFERIGSTGDGFGAVRWGKPCNDTG